MPGSVAPAAVGRLVRHRALPVVVVVTSLLACVLGWYHGDRAIERNARERFRHTADDVTELLQERLRDHEAELRGAAAFVRATPELTRERWREYVGALGNGDKVPGVVGIGFVPRVAHAEVATFEARLRSEGMAGFAITPASNLPQHLPVTYFAPESAAYQRALGFDIATDATRAATLSLAAEAGQSVVVEAARLAGDGAADPVFVQFLPVYAPGQSLGSVAQRRASLVGFVYLLFHVSEFAAAAEPANREGLGVVLRGRDGAVLHRAGAARDRQALGAFHESRLLAPAGQSWALELVAGPGWYRPAERAMPVAVALGAAVVNGGLILLLLAQRRVRSEAEALVAQKDDALTRSEGAFLAVTESARVAIVLTDSHGRFTYANAAAEAMFGVPRARLVGSSSMQYVAEADRERFREGLEKFLAGQGRIAAGAPTPITGLRASGEEFPAEVALSWFDSAGARYITGVIVDLSERVRAEVAALEAEARWKVAIESTDDGVWDRDIEAGVLHGSRRLFEMLGYEAADGTMRDDEWYGLIHPDDVAAARADLHDHLSGARAQYVSEYRTRMPDGSYRWVLGRGRVISRSPDGAPLRMVGTCTDITERRQAEETLRFAREQAEQAARSKSDFLAMMSHELRTPMNGVLGMTNLLSSTSLTEEQREYLEMIGRSGHALLRLIDDILDFSKIEAGRVVLEQMSSDVGALAQEVVTLLGVQAQAKGLQLEATIAPGTPTVVVIDPGRLRQVLFNLVGNAIKFTEAGGVTVGVSADSLVDGRVTLRVEVTDTGIGIPEEKQRLLFQKFSQADASTTRRFGGTGLGLAISKGLVESMGGRIGVTSAVGRGSQFWFTVQAAVAAGAVPEAQPFAIDTGAAAASAQPSPQRRVLVAEDNPVNQRVAVRMLEKLGYSVDVAVDGREAVQMARSGSYAAILMDCHMPEVDGFEATRQIRRALPGEARPPILAMTAAATEVDRERCLACGMDDYLRKPVQMPDLRAMLDRWVRPSAPPAR
ncbi:hypothetical protein TBR22_A45960 [Luteitalea sp. TBR-22]|nr:hypothetical protein TBR22_A45960 [Luteitalea sp. TBR-22]